MHSQKGNIISSGAGFFSFLFGFGPPILKWLGYADLAIGMEQNAAIWGAVNWTPIYMLAFCVCMSYLAFNNADFVIRKYRQYEHSKKRDWDTSVAVAVRYIAEQSVLSNGLNDETKAEVPIRSFMEAAANGKIKVSGRRTEGNQLEEIPAKEWQGSDRSLIVKSTRSRYGETAEHKSALISHPEKDKPAIILYQGLLIDAHEIERVWPRISGSPNWRHG